MYLANCTILYRHANKLTQCRFQHIRHKIKNGCVHIPNVFNELSYTFLSVYSHINMITVNYVALASVFMVVGRTVDMDIFIIQLSFTMPNGAMEAGKVQKRKLQGWYRQYRIREPGRQVLDRGRGGDLQPFLSLGSAFRHGWL